MHSNYGRADLSKRKFLKLVSQLDDNIMYLCMAQVGEVCSAQVDTACCVIIQCCAGYETSLLPFRLCHPQHCHRRAPSATSGVLSLTRKLGGKPCL